MMALLKSNASCDVKTTVNAATALHAAWPFKPKYLVTCVMIVSFTPAALREALKNEI